LEVGVAYSIFLDRQGSFNALSDPLLARRKQHTS